MKPGFDMKDVQRAHDRSVHDRRIALLLASADIERRETRNHIILAIAVVALCAAIVIAGMDL